MISSISEVAPSVGMKMNAVLKRGIVGAFIQRSPRNFEIKYRMSCEEKYAFVANA